MNFITSSCWTGKRSNCLKILQGYVFIFLNAEPALHLLDEAIATPRQPLHTASSLLRTVGTPTPLRQQPISALRHSACKYAYTLYYSCTCVVMMYKLIKSCYYSFKIFPRFWLAKSTRLIHHNQLLMTKFGRILCLVRKWRQKCSVLAG